MTNKPQAQHTDIIAPTNASLEMSSSSIVGLTETMVLPLEKIEKTTPATSMLAEEEDYPEPETLQEELNAITDAFYEVVPEEDIRAFQRVVEDIQNAKIAEQALSESTIAPTFELKDQDGDTVSLEDLLKEGPVVLTFYRGKWCPHCNATLMRYSKFLVPALEPYNTTIVALSPMLPDGTAFLASKRDLRFSVCSDFDCELAKQFGITFSVDPHSRPWLDKWGENLPNFNGVDSWEIPLPATFVISPNGRIHWSFVDNDPGVRAGVDEIVAQVADACAPSTLSKRRRHPKLFNRKIASTFRFGIKTSNIKFWESNKKTAEETVKDPTGQGEEFSSENSFSSSLPSTQGNRGFQAGSSTRNSWNRSTSSKGKRKYFQRAASAGAFLGRYMISLDKNTDGISQ